MRSSDRCGRPAPGWRKPSTQQTRAADRGKRDRIARRDVEDERRDESVAANAPIGPATMPLPACHPLRAGRSPTTPRRSRPAPSARNLAVPTRPYAPALRRSPQRRAAGRSANAFASGRQPRQGRSLRQSRRGGSASVGLLAHRIANGGDDAGGLALQAPEQSHRSLRQLRRREIHRGAGSRSGPPPRIPACPTRECRRQRPRPRTNVRHVRWSA